MSCYDAASARSTGQASTSGRHEESSITLKGGHTLFVWGLKSSLQPQGILQWPIWLHPRIPGLFTFHCVWYYEPSTPVEGLKFRFVVISPGSACVALTDLGMHVLVCASQHCSRQLSDVINASSTYNKLHSDATATFIGIISSESCQKIARVHISKVALVLPGCNFVRNPGNSCLEIE